MPVRSSDHPAFGARYPELAGRVAVVTGAARGMGAVFARGLAAAGVTVHAGDLDVDAMFATASDINAEDYPGTVHPALLDVRDPASHAATVDRAVSLSGRLDIWVNNAGVFPGGDVLSITAEQLRSTYSVNVDGVLFGAQAAGRQMVVQRSGVIVNLASVAAYGIRPGRAAYGTSKAAVDHLTRFLAVELGAYQVRVNAIAPGFVDTSMTADIQGDEELMARALNTVPLQRIGSPEDILGALLFLVSDSAQYITAATLSVDGGRRYSPQ